jgi:hypothetical protein
VKKLTKAQFLARMAAGRKKAAAKRASTRLTPGASARAGKKNPAKFDRCVNAVKKKGGAVNAFAVCAPTRKNAGPKSARKTKKFLKSKGHKITSGKSPRAKALSRIYRANGGRRNPEGEAFERYEYFHGPGAKGADVVTDVTEKLHEHSVLSGIGKLANLRIRAIDGSGIVKLEKFGGALLAQDEKGKQLFIKGGNQSVNLKDFGIDEPHETEILGALLSVAYRTDKTHLRPEDGGQAEYNHVFGKNGSRLPMMIYHVRNKLLEVGGGGYDLPEVGIRG